MSAKTESYGSRFLYSEDLLHKQQYMDANVIVQEVFEPGSLKAADGRVIDKWTLRFEGKEKMLVIGKTNTSIIHHIVGEPPGPEWIGKQIRLQVREVEAFGEIVPAIRVMPPNGCMIRRSLIKRLGKKAVWKGAE